MQERHFTLEEARALLPRLIPMLEALREGARALAGLERQSASQRNARARTNGAIHHGAESGRPADVERAVRALEEQLAAIQALGVVVKDVDQGLIDFPSLREGRTVYLCYRLGEPTVAWWHEIAAGFAGRQPLE
jgi:hypothetical protein